MNIKKIKDNLLHLNNLRIALGYFVFQNAIKSKTKHKILEQIPHGNVLVIAPHPDDDIFGCGGTISLHVEQGDKVKIVYLTGKGTLREEEAKSAIKVLGVTDVQFLNLKDGAISANKKTVLELSDLISEDKPEIIDAPSFLDPNKDHFEAANILAQALKKVPYSGTIFLYEVWSPIYTNRLVVIDKTFEAKSKAMSMHKSQLKDRDYLSAMIGLAQYRAGMFNAGKYAEAFFACNKELYIQLFNLVSSK